MATVGLSMCQVDDRHVVWAEWRIKIQIRMAARLMKRENVAQGAAVGPGEGR